MIEAINQLASQASAIGGNIRPIIGTDMNAATANAPTGFADMLSQIAEAAVGKVERAEQLSVAKMTGAEVGLREIVDAVMEAQQTLNTTIAIRDKIVQAYIEISHMQI